MVVIIKVELRSYRDQNLRCMSVCSPCFVRCEVLASCPEAETSFVLQGCHLIHAFSQTVSLSVGYAISMPVSVPSYKLSMFDTICGIVAAPLYK
jgi:hypothetical protein